MNIGKIINIVLLLLNWLQRVNCKLVYDYNNATLLRLLPLIRREFIDRIFPDYPCLFLDARPESYIHNVVLKTLYQELSPDIAVLNTNAVHSDSVCRGMIIVSTSMNVSVDFIIQNQPFYKNMRIYIILIKYWDQYLFFQEHWSRKLLDMEVLVITVFPRQLKIYIMKSHYLEFKMTGLNKKTDYFPSFLTLPNPEIMDYKGRQIVVSTFKCHLFNTLQALNKSNSALKNPSYIDSLYGIEERIFLEIAFRMNLTWKLRIPREKRIYGFEYSNKSLSGGLMDDLYKGKADMGFCALWYDQVKIKSFDMSVFWSAVCPKFLFPKPTKLQTNWQNLFEPFNWKIWTLLFSCILLQTYVLMWMSVRALRLKMISTKYYLHPMNSFLEVIRILFMAGCKSNKKMPRLGPLRHLISWWFVFSLVIATIYSTSYYSHLTSPEYTAKIDGIQELREQNVRWGSSFPPPHPWIFHSSNSIHKEYSELFELEGSIQDRIDRLSQGNYAVYCTNLNNLFFMDVDEISSDLLSQLRSFRACLGQYFVSFGLRMGTSYLDQVNTIILRLMQSGIVDYWLIRVVFMHYHRNPFSNVYEYKPQDNKNTHQPLSFSSLEGAFYLYLVGAALASAVFLLELRQGSILRSKEKLALHRLPTTVKPRCPRIQRSRRVMQSNWR